MFWKIWEKFRDNKRIYMVRYSHGTCYAWEIWDNTSVEYKIALKKGWADR